MLKENFFPEKEEFSREEERSRQALIKFAKKLLSFMEKGRWFKVLFLTNHQTKQSLFNPEHNTPKEITVAFGVEGLTPNCSPFYEEIGETYLWNHFETRRVLKCILLFRKEAQLHFREYSFCEQDYANVKKGSLSVVGAIKKPSMSPIISLETLL